MTTTSHSIIALGGRHTGEREENDFYATEPVAADLLVKAESLTSCIWECACGAGHLAERFKELGHAVIASDIIERGYPSFIRHDFLADPPRFALMDETIDTDARFCPIDIVTNPPFNLAEKFIRRGMEILSPGRRLCFFLKLTFMESEKRDELFNIYPSSRIHVCRRRIKCAKNGDFSLVSASPTCYAWFIWEKGYTGKTIINRI